MALQTVVEVGLDGWEVHNKDGGRDGRGRRGQVLEAR